MSTMGFNEALLLTALADGEERKLSEVVANLERLGIGRPILEPTAHVALQRMLQRNLVTAEKREITSIDGRQRVVWFYKISKAGRVALQQTAKEARIIGRAKIANLLASVLP
jgi:hypothetical protein